MISKPFLRVKNQFLPHFKKFLKKFAKILGFFKNLAEDASDTKKNAQTIS